MFGCYPLTLNTERRLNTQFFFLLLYEGLVCALFWFVLEIGYFDLSRGIPFFLVSYILLERSNKCKLNNKIVLNINFNRIFLTPVNLLDWAI